jgi:acyl-CoA synthetase (NDP forming)
VPVYSFPESACRVIRHLCDYRRYRDRPQGKVKHFRGVDRKRVREQIEQVRKDGRVDLRLSELREVAVAYGARLTREGLAGSEDEAVAVAAAIGYPVVLKVVATRLRRKSDVGGVELDIRTEAELRLAYRRVLESVTRRLPSAQIEGVLVQQMLRGGQELVLAGDHDSIFGPVLRLGAGGQYAGIFQDFQSRIIPITLREATEMVRGLKIFPLLNGGHGREPVNLASLVDLLCRASQLIEEFEEIREFEINPLIIFPRRKDFWAVDGKMRLFKPEELKRRSNRAEW